MLIEGNPKKDGNNLNDDITLIDSPSHQQLAYEAALQSIVLLQNKNNLLPLDMNGQKSVAVIGPHIDAHYAFMSNYHGDRCGCPGDGGVDSCIKSPLETIKQKMKFHLVF